MAQAARQNGGSAVAIRHTKPAIFNGTDAAWRVLCDQYATAESPEIIMAIVEYCAAKRLDPFAHPVHIVPMWNSKLRRRVQTVMRGINEIEIIASRTGAWAGMDLPQWGPEVERTFRGQIESDDGSKRNVELRMKYPLWCSVTVHKLVGGAKQAFSAQLFWDECYGTAGFKSEVPNERWSKAPRQMLHKCTLAAALRATFPEEHLGYAAEEAEDREISSGGVTLEGVVDHGDPELTPRDRQASQSYAPDPPDEPVAGLALLEEQNGTQWLRNLRGLLAGVTSVSQAVEIAAHPRVRHALANAPSLIKEDINSMLKAAHERLAPAGDPQDAATGDRFVPDEVAELVAEVEATETVEMLDMLEGSSAWRARTNELFPPDAVILQEVVDTRRAILKGRNP